MRYVFLDTETTGLDPALGHRIVEIAAVEVCNRRLTGRHFHQYVNPGRESDEGALRVHGLTQEFLRDKPVFQDICREFVEFIDNSEVFIHNAPFDTGFIDHELALIRYKPMQTYCLQIVDTLTLARELHPGRRNNLDALCERYQIDNSHRTLHGALLDAELLADVYLAMTRGQESLLMERDMSGGASQASLRAMEDLTLIIQPPNQTELVLHDQLMERIHQESKGSCLWRTEEADD